MNSLIALVIIFGSYATPVAGDVAAFPSLPAYGVLCQETEVMNAPEGSTVLYVLPVDTRVQLREQPRFRYRDWVMIRPAEWIPLAAICK